MQGARLAEVHLPVQPISVDKSRVNVPRRCLAQGVYRNLKTRARVGPRRDVQRRFFCSPRMVSKESQEDALEQGVCRMREDDAAQQRRFAGEGQPLTE